MLIPAPWRVLVALLPLPLLRMCSLVLGYRGPAGRCQISPIVIQVQDAAVTVHRELLPRLVDVAAVAGPHIGPPYSYATARYCLPRAHYCLPWAYSVVQLFNSM